MKDKQEAVRLLRQAAQILTEQPLLPAPDSVEVNGQITLNYHVNSQTPDEAVTTVGSLKEMMGEAQWTIGTTHVEIAYPGNALIRVFLPGSPSRDLAAAIFAAGWRAANESRL